MSCTGGMWTPRKRASATLNQRSRSWLASGRRSCQSHRPALRCRRSYQLQLCACPRTPPPGCGWTVVHGRVPVDDPMCAYKGPYAAHARFPCLIAIKVACYDSCIVHGCRHRVLRIECHVRILRSFQLSGWIACYSYSSAGRKAHLSQGRLDADRRVGVRSIRKVARILEQVFETGNLCGPTVQLAHGVDHALHGAPHLQVVSPAIDGGPAVPCVSMPNEARNRA